MYWTGKGGPRFIRPIRWIVALLGDEIVPFELAGVHSGAVTSGHRRLGARAIAVTTADYEQRLRENYVILKAEERRQKIHNELAQVRVKPDRTWSRPWFTSPSTPRPSWAASMRSFWRC